MQSSWRPLRRRKTCLHSAGSRTRKNRTGLIASGILHGKLAACADEVGRTCPSAQDPLRLPGRRGALQNPLLEYARSHWRSVAKRRTRSALRQVVRPSSSEKRPSHPSSRPPRPDRAGLIIVTQQNWTKAPSGRHARREHSRAGSGLRTVKLDAFSARSLSHGPSNRWRPAVLERHRTTPTSAHPDAKRQ
jgi:hypothetical protein